MDTAIIKIKYEDKTSNIEVSTNETINDILLEENIPIEAVVIKKNDVTVTEDETVTDGDVIEVIRVIYGG